LASAAGKAVTWTIDGVKRQAIVYAPSKATPKPPLILSFHGHGDTADNFQYVDLHKAWPEAVVVYPQGLPSPRDGAPGWQVRPGEDNDRDLKLVDFAIAELRKTYSIDDARIYSTGFSNGANLSYLLWAVRPRVFAAYAPVAGMLRGNFELTEAKPMIHIVGSQDHQNEYTVQLQSIELAKRVNAVSPAGERCSTTIPTGACLAFAPSSAAAGAPVMTVIHKGGHEYPTGTSERIVEFLKQYKLEPARPAAK
jgi:polyhydroxybutyrate depolymerase